MEMHRRNIRFVELLLINEKKLYIKKNDNDNIYKVIKHKNYVVPD